ncbi:MAG: sugar phosphate isomerase/epimerase, partial [Planctomycetes bacterium]|nr:sugar phosphate isomerase/epimerase [Planctomycetota bacterium]
MAAGDGICVSCEYHCNTLTDTNASAQQLISELGDCGVKLLWQPPNGESFEYCMEGLEAVLEKVTNIHTFHWINNGKGEIERRPLGEGEERWVKYLKKAASDGVVRYALIEFVFDGTPEQFSKDAAALKSWLGKL